MILKVRLNNIYILYKHIILIVGQKYIQNVLKYTDSFRRPYYFHRTEFLLHRHGSSLDANTEKKRVKSQDLVRAMALSQQT